MAGLDSDGTTASAMILSTAYPDSTSWLDSLIYLLRRDKIFHQELQALAPIVLMPNLFDNHTAKICFFGRDPSG